MNQTLTPSRMGAQGHAQTPLMNDLMESNQRQSPLITSVPTVIHTTTVIDNTWKFALSRSFSCE